MTEEEQTKDPGNVIRSLNAAVDDVSNLILNGSITTDELDSLDAAEIRLRDLLWGRGAA